MYGFRNKLNRFLEGRYGLRGISDSVQIVICCVYLLLVVINVFARSRIISAILLVLLGLTLFRVLSKNILKRENEDRAVREWLFRLRDAFQNGSRQAEIRKGALAWANTKRPGAAKDETFAVTSFAALGRCCVGVEVEPH